MDGPDSDDLTRRQRVIVHLSYEDGGDCLVQRRAVHVDSCANRQNESRHTLVDAQVLLETTKRYRQRPSTG